MFVIVINKLIMSSNQEIKQNSTTYSFSSSGRYKVCYISVSTNDRCSSDILFWNIETAYKVDSSNNISDDAIISLTIVH